MGFKSFTDKLLSRTLIAISVFHDTQSLFSTIDPNPTSSLNVSCPDPTDMSYGVAVWNHLLVFQLNLSLMTLLILLLCLTVLISAMKVPSGSISTFHDFHFAISSIPTVKYCKAFSHLLTIFSPTLDGESLLSSSLLSSSTASSDVCKTVVLHESLMDFTCFTFIFSNSVFL